MSGKVVFWDFDGTLGFGPHGPGAWAPCLIEALDALHAGHTVTPNDVRPYTRDNYPWHRHETPHPEFDTADKWWAPLEALFCTAFSGLGFAGTAADLSRRTRTFYSDGSRWGVYDDVRPALERLRNAGWRHVILSNNIPELEDNVLRHLGLGDVIDVVLSSAVIGYEKPHPESYAIALRAAGNPARSWMVGDSVIADVVGAEAAGLRAILVRTRDDAAARRADDLDGVADIILSDG